MSKKLCIAAAFMLLASAVSAQAQVEWTSGRPDGHAPIGVMQDHMHERGEFMLSFRFMNMGMKDNLTGTDEVAASSVVAPFPGGSGFMVTPTEMPMQMYMAGLMYAPSDRVTLMVMGNYLSASMDHVMRNGNMFTTESSGVGDTSLSAMLGLKQQGATRLHLNLGFTLPTGSTEQMDQTPMSEGNEVVLPYPMQVGSGTFDLRPGATFLGMTEGASYGLQAFGTVRTGENDRGYTLGNKLDVTGWFAVRAGSQFSFSVRGLLTTWQDIEGSDAALNPMMAPTMNTNLRGGTRLDIPLGINYSLPGEALAGHRLLAEYHIPVYQDLDGPQLKTTGILTIGWQKSIDPGE